MDVLLHLFFILLLVNSKIMFQLSDNAHESRLKEVIEKYLRNNNYSLGGTDVRAAGEFVEKLDVSGGFVCFYLGYFECIIEVCREELEAISIKSCLITDPVRGLRLWQWTSVDL